jgi:hypothetical protein
MNKQKFSRFDFKQKAVALAAVASVLVVGTAQAAYTLPAPATAAFADMKAAWDAVEVLIWPVVMAVLIGMFAIRKTKQGANKA